MFSLLSSASQKASPSGLQTIAHRVKSSLPSHSFNPLPTRGSRAWRRPPSHLVAPRSNVAPSTAAGVDPSHFQESWSDEQIMQASAESVLLTWSPSKVKNDFPIMVRGSGVHLYDSTGKEWMDWTSQAVCANSGQTVSPRVKAAINKQLDSMAFVYGGFCMSESRARLSKLICEILPKGLSGVTFPSSGSEANEAAIAMARRYTGKQKIMTFYRSYHGGTNASSNATGDCRRLQATPAPNFVKCWNPTPNMFEFSGSTEQERTASSLLMLEEQIIMEGPDTIASIMMESIPGSAGVLFLPDGYMQGVRALCDKYKILLHIDEVMVGFGRTGKMWGFQHYEGVVPDIVTSAKGLTASIMPLSMCAISDDMNAFFQENSLGWGSTFQAHPTAVACGYANVLDMLENDTVGHVARLDSVFAAHIKETAEKHPCIKQWRSAGFFGCLDIHNPLGEQDQMFHESHSRASAAYVAAYKKEGLLGFFRAPLIHIAPPLIIDEEELEKGFAKQNRALDVLDRELGF